MSAPPPVPARKNASLFHGFKRTIFSPDEVNKTVDEAYNDLKAEFTRYSNSTARLATEVRLLSQRLADVTSATSTTYKVLSETYATPNSATAESSSDAADALYGTHRSSGPRGFRENATHATTSYESLDASSLGQARDSLSAASEVLSKVSEEASALRVLFTRRDEALKELDYYNNKVDGLEKDKEKIIRSGKQFKSSDQEKLDRNLEKQRERKAIYDSEHAQTYEAMVKFLTKRYDRIEEAVAALAKGMITFTRGYSAAALSAADATGHGVAPAPVNEYTPRKVEPEAPATPAGRALPPPPGSQYNGPSDYAVPIMAPRY